MLRTLFAIFLILPTVLFYGQMSMFPMAQTMGTENGLVFASQGLKDRRALEEQNGVRAVREEVARQVASVAYAETGWQQTGFQSMYLMCMRRPDRSDASSGPAPDSTAIRQSRCQCLAQGALVAEDRSQMRYIVLKALMIERLEYLRVRLPQGDVVDDEIAAAVALDRSLTRPLIERMKKKTASC